jgi:hypothetical protein
MSVFIIYLGPHGPTAVNVPDWQNSLSLRFMGQPRFEGLIVEETRWWWEGQSFKIGERRRGLVRMNEPVGVFDLDNPEHVRSCKEASKFLRRSSTLTVRLRRAIVAPFHAIRFVANKKARFHI